MTLQIHLEKGIEMLKSIVLNAATRRICSSLLNRVGKSDPDSARNVRDVRKRFELAAFDKLCDRLSDQLRGLLGQPLTWRELLDLQGLLDDLDEMDATAATVDPLRKARGRIESLAAPREFTIDDSLLKWLQSLCTTVNWNKMKIQSPMGGVSEADIDVSSEQLEAFADFVDAVNGAIASQALSEKE